MSRVNGKSPRAAAPDEGEIWMDGPEENFRQIPDALLFDPEAKDVDIRVYGCLRWYGRNRAKRAFPGRDDLAERIHKASVRTIDSSFDRLMAMGFLQIIPRFDQETGRQQSNLYRVYFEPLPEDQRQVSRPGTMNGSIGADRRKSIAQAAVSAAQMGVQNSAPSPEDPSEGEGAKNCTPGGATDCTGGAQNSAPLTETNGKGHNPKRDESNPASAVGDDVQVVRPVDNLSGTSDGETAEIAADAGRQDLVAGSELYTTDRRKASKTRVPAELLRVALDIYRGLPEPVRSGIPERASKPVVAVIVQELRYRTPDELLKRVARNWQTFAFQELRDSVAVAVRLLRRGRDCPHVLCEDGVNLETGLDCQACADAARTPAAAPQVEPFEFTSTVQLRAVCDVYRALPDHLTDVITDDQAHLVYPAIAAELERCTQADLTARVSARRGQAPSLADPVAAAIRLVTDPENRAEQGAAPAPRSGAAGVPSAVETQELLGDEPIDLEAEAPKDGLDVAAMLAKYRQDKGWAKGEVWTVGVSA